MIVDGLVRDKEGAIELGLPIFATCVTTIILS
jgi:regulator of RNase E activity RraA